MSPFQRKLSLLTRVLAMLFFVLAYPGEASSQDTATIQPVPYFVSKPRVTVLLPLYLDSMYTGTNYRYTNTVPRFVLPALEFYHGLQLAADSLSAEGIPAEIRVVDTRKNGSLEAALRDPVLLSSELLIGFAQNSAELNSMAAFAARLNIPFISATYPNDGGITGNPNLIILNSTLKTHCEAIYKRIQAQHATDNLLVFTRKGNVENYLRNWLQQADTTTRSLPPHWKIVTLSDSVSQKEITAYLDSNRLNTIVGLSLDRNFNLRVLRHLAAASTSYTVNTIGMPTWDDYPLKNPEYKGTTVYFTTPFVSYSANAQVYETITRKFALVVNSRPSDMAFKGFEITYRFTKTLSRYRNRDAFLEHVNLPDARIFSDFRVMPVYSEELPPQVQYLENKRLYFVKLVDGQVKGIY